MTTIATKSMATHAKERRTRFDSKALLALPGLLFMTVAFAVPVILLIIESFSGPQGPTLDGYRKVLADIALQDPAAFTRLAETAKGAIQKAS